jgi:serine/threonine protein kinase/tetratricopeptide (TPR) repeat protein
MNDDFRDAAADDPTGAGPTEAARTEAMDADAAPPAADWPRIGPYDVIRTLGSGGMGTVYLARQRDPIDRLVAIKVIRGGLRPASSLAARFDAERRVLGLMNHPNIARIFDAGTTPDGEPYFVMEYIEGENLVSYCDRHRLGVRERLELFLEVAEGVQHAHQKGIIHRDLKPGNILVAAIDGRPVPRIIDFGLAKALESTTDTSSPHTQVGQVVGTPAYMSPEQASGDPGDLDIRVDVYSLGVILHLLLVAKLPGDLGTRSRVGASSVTPSSRLARLGPEADTIAEQRRCDLKALLRVLRGDLNWIILRAIDEDRERRYPSVDALADDLRRHLSDHVISARPQTTMYRLRKLAARRTGLFTAATVLILGVIAGLAGTAIGLVKARQGEQVARAEAAKLTAVNRFLNDMLTSSNPRAQGRDVRVVDVLDSVSENIDQTFDEAPDIEAAIRTTMGESYLALGEYDQAAVHIASVRELLGADTGDLNDDTARVEGLWADLLYYLGRLPESEAAYRRLWAFTAERDGPNSPTAVQYKQYVADTLTSQGRTTEAGALYEDVVQQLKMSLGPKNPRTANAMTQYAAHLSASGDAEQARILNEKALAIFEAEYGSEHPDTLDTLNNLAISCYRSGDAEAAEVYFRRTLDASRVVMGDNHPDTLTTMKSLATLLFGMGKDAEAEALLREALAGFTAQVGPEHPRTLSTMGALSLVVARQGRNPAEAEDLARTVYDTLHANLGPDHVASKVATRDLAEVLYANGDHSAALKVIEPLVATVANDPENHNPGLHTSETLMAVCLAELGDTARAERHFKRAIERLDQRFGPDAKVTRDARCALGNLLRDRGASFEELQRWGVEDTCGDGASS